MPAVSRQQQKFLFWRFGARWVKAHHFDNRISGRQSARKTKASGR